MSATEIRPGIYWIGVNDRTTDLFEGLWPVTANGVSYNSYLINDEKKVIIDLSKSFKTDEFFAQIADIVELSSIDYIVVNHMEPDHSGVLRTLKMISPKIQILATPKARPMLENFYGLGANVREVADGEILTTGKHSLKFVHTPFVHWPETMMTYETTEKILFSCDGFGGYGALRGSIFDDECRDIKFYEEESLRYFVNIVAKFATPVLKAIGKFSGVPLNIIAPSHGLVWRKNPLRILQLYKQWCDMASGKTETGITMVYGSMYGNTETVMNAVCAGVARAGIDVNIFDAARTHVSYILPSLWKNTGIIIGAPTYEGSLFPPVRQVLDMAGEKAIRNKKAAFFGSYGWSGGGARQATKLLEDLKWELFNSLEFAGSATREILTKAEELGFSFANMIKSEKKAVPEQTQD